MSESKERLERQVEATKRKKIEEELKRWRKEHTIIEREEWERMGNSASQCPERTSP